MTALGTNMPAHVQLTLWAGTETVQILVDCSAYMYNCWLHKNSLRGQNRNYKIMLRVSIHYKIYTLIKDCKYPTNKNLIRGRYCIAQKPECGNFNNFVQLLTACNKVDPAENEKLLADVISICEEFMKVNLYQNLCMLLNFVPFQFNSVPLKCMWDNINLISFLNNLIQYF